MRHNMLCVSALVLRAGIMRSRVKKYAFLYSLFLIYSLFSVLAKFAGRYPLLSWPAILLYGACFFIIGVYAVLWQQVLKRMPLTIAYPNRAVTIPLGMLWGALLFGETVKWNMILGTAVILLGIVLMVTRNE